MTVSVLKRVMTSGMVLGGTQAAPTAIQWHSGGAREVLWRCSGGTLEVLGRCSGGTREVLGRHSALAEVMRVVGIALDRVDADE